ncbi:MAG TPA: VOC family protein [Steroidobacteraceae bacterium]|jgi:predicted enzyme related to lactoylglutathione lyase
MNTTDDTGRCQSVCPIMPTTDVGRSVRFYESLGYTVAVHGDFVMTRRDGIELFLSLMPDHDPKRTASCVFVRVDDAEALHARWQAAGPDRIKPLRNTNYGMREFAVLDPDGNMMLYASPLRTA